MQTFVASRKYLALVCMLHRKQVILLYEELTLCGHVTEHLTPYCFVIGFCRGTIDIHESFTQIFWFLCSHFFCDYIKYLLCQIKACICFIIFCIIYFFSIKSCIFTMVFFCLITVREKWIANNIHAFAMQHVTCR